MIEVILVIGVCYSLLTCALIYYSYAHKTIKAAALSFLVLCGIFTFDHYQKNLSTPIVGKPEYEFVYMHHVIQDDSLVLWAKSTETKKNRLHIFPYDRETAKELQRGKENQQNGQDMAGEFKKGSQRNPGLRLDNWIGESDPIPKNNQ